MDNKKYCKCGNEARSGQRNCQQCHNAYMREWRKRTPLTLEQKKKDACRSYAGVYKRRGKIIQQSCEICGNAHTEMHHNDYDKPLEINWLCRKCHIDLHMCKT